jgi:3-oxoacyl-[acyl-carrier protein] reductase
MKSLADNLVSELRANGGRAIAVAGDLSDPTVPQAMIRRTRSNLGEVNVVVANAAASLRIPWNDILIEEWGIAFKM